MGRLSLSTPRRDVTVKGCNSRGGRGPGAGRARGQRAARWTAGVVLALAAATGSITTAASAAPQALQAQAPQGWTDLDKFPQSVQDGPVWVRPLAYRALRLDRAALNASLADVPKEVLGRGAQGGVRISLPMPDGTSAEFDVVESSVMEPALQAQFPDIKSYLGQGVTDPAATVRFDVSPIGLRAQILSPNGAVYIDPWTKGDWTHYASYYKRDLGVPETPFRCGTMDVVGNADGVPNIGTGGVRRDRGETARSGTVLRTFRLAIAATGEFTAFHGSQANAVAVVNTVANRVTGVYETELSTRLVLVGNNNLIVYAAAGTDPYTTPGANATTLSQNVTAINGAIGVANYDVGHLVHRGAADGVAGAIGNVCGTNKAQGISVFDPPVGDPLAIDYVSHELGHQFGGRHSFNNCNGGAGDSTTIAHEPGSGSTIMGYAGICGANNLQPNSDPLFASINIDQMLSYIGTLTCDVETPTGNSVPSVSAGGLAFTIPARTAFTLTAIGDDANGDTLTYTWEQRNGGSAVTVPASGPLADNGASPLFRVLTPTLSPSRTFPRYETVLAGFTPISYLRGEGLPTTGRTMNFRVTARDNRAGGSGLNSADVTITTAATASAFAIVSPNGGENWFGSRTVTWVVAGTNGPPVNTASVNILLSTDGGQTFPITLASGVPNTGAATVTFPNISSSAARVRVEPVGNVYFDISNANFTVTPVPTVPIIALSGTPTLSDTTGNGNSNGRADPGESDLRLGLTAINTGGVSASSVTATLESLTATASVVGGAINFGDLAVGASAPGLQPGVIALSPSHVCGSPVNLRANFSSPEGTWSSDFVITTGGSSGPGTPVTVNYAGAPVAIADSPSTVGGSAVIAVSGLTGTISNLQVRIGGTTCSTAAGSTTVGIDHTYVGDLEIRLTSPSGTTVLLIDQLNNGAGNNGTNNFCQTLLQDGAPASIQAATTAPFTGTFAPANPLSAFNGQNPNGTWTLNALDLAADDIGSIRAFSLIITPQAAPTCDPPTTPSIGACCSGSTCAAVVSADCAGANQSFAGVGTTCNAPGSTAPCCRANFNQVGGLSVQDIFDFLSAYFAGSAQADFNGGGLSVQDIFDFLAQYFAGC